MRHQKNRLRLKQKPAHARMLQRNLVTSLLLYESVRTTKKRAQVIQPVIDRLINVAKTRPPHIAVRFINRTVTDKNASRKIMEVYKDRFSDCSSGLTRMVPVGVRKGDGAELVDLSLVGAETTADSGDQGSGIRDQGIQSSSSPESRVPSPESRSKKKSSTKEKS